MEVGRSQHAELKMQKRTGLRTFQEISGPCVIQAIGFEL